MGKKHRGRSAAKKINVEIAPGNQTAMDRYIRTYNRRPDRTTPKVGYTDLVNEALDRFLASRPKRKRGTGAAKGGRAPEAAREEKLE